MPPDPVHIGKDGWLFLVSGSNTVFDLYKSQSSFTDEMASAWVERLSERTSRLQEKGIKYLHLPAPEKLTVLHKFYNGKIENIHGSPIIQLSEKHASALPCLVNVLPVFSTQIDNFPIYWKTDTHWSFWGCFSAYQLLCSRMGQPSKADLLDYPFDEGEVLFDLGAKLAEKRKEKARFYKLVKNAEREYVNSLVRFKEEHEMVNEINLHVGSHVVYKNTANDAVDKCVVLFGDSFSENRPHLLTGMLAETFREVHFIWNASLDYTYIDRIRPDFVVSELAERFMTRIPVDDLSIDSFADDRIAEFKKNVLFSAKDSQGVDKVFEYVELLPTETYNLDPPLVVQNDCVNIGNDTKIRTNPVKIYNADNARLFFDGTKWMVKSAEGEVIAKCGANAEELLMPWSSCRKVAGTTMLLGASQGAHCYYHWMLDLLPRLGILQKNGVDLTAIDYYLVREITAAFQIETLERLGVTRDKIIETKNDPLLQCERLIHVDLNNGVNMKMNRFVPNWLKHVYPPKYELSDRIKLYISRPQSVRRGVANEEQLLPILEQFHYTVSTMEGLSIEEQSNLLGRADVLVSPHGGGLTNMVFCKPGIQVVELFGRHVYPYYYGLAHMCGHEYHAVLENKDDYPRLIRFRNEMVTGGSESYKEKVNATFHVDPQVFRSTLQAIG